MQGSPESLTQVNVPAHTDLLTLISNQISTLPGADRAFPFVAADPQEHSWALKAKLRCDQTLG